MIKLSSELRSLLWAVYRFLSGCFIFAIVLFGVVQCSSSIYDATEEKKQATLLTMTVEDFDAIRAKDSITHEENELLRARIDWKRSEYGTQYYVECVEGFEFVVTSSTHGYNQYAGPIGTCKQ